jgi:hypothetical protein
MMRDVIENSSALCFVPRASKWRTPFGLHSVHTGPMTEL